MQSDDPKKYRIPMASMGNYIEDLEDHLDELAAKRKELRSG